MTSQPARNTLIPGREETLLPEPGEHAVLGTPLSGPWPEGTEVIYLAGGCFWGVERFLWRQPGVVATAVGYMGGTTPNATYREVCTGETGHAETVRVAYDPAVVGEGAQALLRTFWENHDSTQLNRHGNDIGTQYRSAVWTTTPQQAAAAREIRGLFQGELTRLAWGSASPRSTTPPRSTVTSAAPSTWPRSTTRATWRRTRTATATTDPTA